MLRASKTLTKKFSKFYDIRIIFINLLHPTTSGLGTVLKFVQFKNVKIYFVVGGMIGLFK